VTGEPDAGGQRDDSGDAGDDTEQAQAFAAAFWREQQGGERAGGDAAEAEAMNVSASGMPTSRDLGGAWVRVRGPACVELLISRTVGANRHADKVQFHGD